MTTEQIAKRLVEICRSGQYELAHQELYAENAVSLEPQGAPVERVEGLESIRQKGKQWVEMVEEMHSAEVSEPIVAGNYFSVTMKNEATFKGMGRQKMEEIAVYQVRDGKIVSEQFFYEMAQQPA